MMKRRILVAVLTLILCMSLSVNVFARNASESGRTTGGSSGVLTTYATLYADYDYGKATTSCGKGSGVTLSTTIIYYFTNASGHTQTSSSSGTTSASAGCVTSQGQKASSQHSVRGGTTWGSWSCSLSTTAW